MKKLFVTVLLIAGSVFAQNSTGGGSVGSDGQESKPLSLQCKKSVAKAIYKKYPSIKKMGGNIDLVDINSSQVPKILEVAFASQEECSAGVEVKVEILTNGKCMVEEISEMMNEQC